MSKFYRRAWQVCFRVTDGSDGLPTTGQPFINVPNPSWGWAADPFLFERDGRLYLFAELFSYLEQRGSIGYCVFQNGRFGRWKKVIDEPFHLSYANIFEQDGEIWICPESFTEKKVYLYRAVDFPDRWERADVIAEGLPLSDTTFYRSGGRTYGFTFNHLARPVELLLFEMKGGKAAFAPAPVSTDNTLARPGGNILHTSEGDIRVGQNCDGLYGKGLAFCRMALDFPHYSETLLARWSPEDIRLQRCPRDLRGLHTFNRLGRYEAIDIQYFETHPLDVLGRVLTAVRRRLSR